MNNIILKYLIEKFFKNFFKSGFIFFLFWNNFKFFEEIEFLKISMFQYFVPYF